MLTTAVGWLALLLPAFVELGGGWGPWLAALALGPALAALLRACQLAEEDGERCLS